METLSSIAIGVFLPFIIQYLKKRGLDGTQSHLILAIVIAVAYTAYQIFTPEPMKENVYQFVAQASFTAVGLYKTFSLVKDYKKKKNKK